MELTDRMIEKYLKSSKKQKSQMITQYCELTHVKRATAVKRFERRKKKYGPVDESIVYKCWELSGCVCAEKVHPMLDVYIDELKRNNNFSLYELSKIHQVSEISLGTLKRVIRKFPKISSKKREGTEY